MNTVFQISPLCFLQLYTSKSYKSGIRGLVKVAAATLLTWVRITRETFHLSLSKHAAALELGKIRGENNNPSHAICEAKAELIARYVIIFLVKVKFHKF